MAEIARLLVQLDEVAPPVRRIVEVPLNIRLDRLHLVIQAAMGWQNYHLYEFSIGRFIRVTPPSPGWSMPETDTLSAAHTTLDGLLERIRAKSKSFKYNYDFGDDWQHTIKVQAISSADDGVAYPRLIAAERACPPEDCGGAPGYEAYVEAVTDPDHPDHEEMIEWRGPGFDPAAVDKKKIESRLASLHKRWNRRKASPA